LIEALTLSLGYNAALVAVGAGLLGIASGVTGSFVFLRKRALVSDAISHATLPGVALAFLVMVAQARGLLAAAIRQRKSQRRVYLRQGLLALAQGQVICEPFTLRLLVREG
jgi:hypothetical protein